MPRQKKQVLTRRKDGRFRTIYKSIPFYSYISSDDAIAQREAYKHAEEQIRAKELLGLTVEAFAQRWMRTAKAGCSEQTRREAEIHLSKMINRLGYMRLNDVKPEDLKEIYAEEYAGLSNSYIQSACQLYKSYFDAAMDNGYIKYNPARMKSAQPHRGPIGSHRAITEEERSWILAYCRDHRAYPAVMAMLYAGIRPQEAKALDLDKAFDRKHMQLMIRESVHIKGSNQYIINTTGKTPKATRTIPVFPPLYEALKHRHGMLVQSATGKPVTIQAWRSVWKSYVTAMETAINGCSKRWYGKTREHRKLLEAGQALPEWRSFTVLPYDLRHSFCVMCRDADPPVEINTCVRWMGHTDAKMILRIYDEVSDRRSEKEARRLASTMLPVQTEVQETDRSL